MKKEEYFRIIDDFLPREELRIDPKYSAVIKNAAKQAFCEDGRSIKKVPFKGNKYQMAKICTTFLWHCRGHKLRELHIYVSELKGLHVVADFHAGLQGMTQLRWVMN